MYLNIFEVYLRLCEDLYRWSGPSWLKASAQKDPESFEWAAHRPQQSDWIERLHPSQENTAHVQLYVAISSTTV